MPKGVGYPTKKMKVNSKKRKKSKVNFSNQMAKVNKIMSKHK